MPSQPGCACVCVCPPVPQSTRMCMCVCVPTSTSVSRDNTAFNEYHNNNEYLQRLTHTGPKRLHVLYKYVLSKFNAYNMNAHTYACTHAQSHTHAPTCAHTRVHTHTHTPVAYQGNQSNESEEKVFKKRERFSRKI